MSPRTQSLAAVVTDADYARLTKRARESGQTNSAYMRSLVNDALEAEGEAPLAELHHVKQRRADARVA